MKNKHKKKEFQVIKSSYVARVKGLQTDYLNAKEPALREYIKQKIIDLILEIKDSKLFNEADTNKIETIFIRVVTMDNYGRFYNYSLAENLKEQVTIISDSIRASPIHQKMLEVANMSITQFKDEIND